MADQKQPTFFTQFDALENIIANIGTDQDKRSHSNYKERYIFSREQLEAMYLENWIFGKIVDIIPDDMTREWRTINSQVEPEQTKEFTAFEEKLEVAAKFNEAQKWARLYGGCGIILGVDEAQGGPIDTPLDVERLGRDALKHLAVVEAERLTYVGEALVLDPTDPNFGEPEFWRLAGTGTQQKIHRSRILFFYGNKLPYYPKKRQRLAYWGAPLARRLFEPMTDSGITTSSIATLITESSHDVIKYKGLQAFLSTPGGEEKVRTRFALMKLLKSINNTTLLDEEETFETHNQTFAGLGDLLDRYMAFNSAAADIPVTRLIGTSAKGLNATGEGDLKNYYDNIKARQKTEFGPNLKRLDRIMQRSVFGQEIDDFGYTWDSLFQLTEVEIATVEKTRAERDNTYFNMGVIDEVAIAKDLYEEGTYTSIDPEFIDELEKAVDQAKKDQEDLLLLGNEMPPEQQEPDDDGMLEL